MIYRVYGVLKAMFSGVMRNRVQKGTTSRKESNTSKN